LDTTSVSRFFLNFDYFYSFSKSRLARVDSQFCDLIIVCLMDQQLYRWHN